MTDNPGPYDLDKTRLILDDKMRAHAKTVTPTSYEDLDKDFGSFAGHVLISKHTWTEPWPTWEVHPHGDETVCLIEGDTDLVLWVDGKEENVRVNEPGACIVVPLGTWHTARPHKPTTMIFFTPGEGTINALEPEGDAL